MGKKSFKISIIVLWVLIVISLAALEFPGVFFINRIYPKIFGLPFIYGFPLVIWVFFCILMYVGYRLKWGQKD